ncbi:hypothetical protein F9C07_2205456 [Aspergillus flavus]|uniref:Transferase family-domain-containing protein n=1 Tax=Aspergillus flavus (strain ATCC 200026 / FGSC A1120 / IAM 13836 / NRRL 3357 / JCM 12722 / SRRC 167) TaxID=332952 RepID=A0A7U2N3H7_ASPFN|nr:hypothetical protein F9C07_2205456 [Aspergillus flavus]
MLAAMAKQEVFYLQPLGWENDPDEERYKVSTLNYLTARSYNNYALFFKLDNVDKPKVVDVLKAGLERTLSQTRHLSGTIEKDSTDGYSFVKRKDSTVRFFVQWLDSSEENFPSFEDIEKAHFSATTLGDLNLWSVPPMTYGLVFIMHHHHYANDVLGWAGFTHQLAENCYAIVNQTPFPTWDLACLDRSRLLKPEVPEEAKVDGPASPERHPDHTVAVSLLFHLPRGKAIELKQLATPTDGSWISTYDAFSAFIWRTLTRLRAPAVDMRRRMVNPKVPPRIQGNIMFAALSPTAPVPQPTLAEIISEWPFPKLASYIRQLTDSMTEESLSQALDVIATIRDKAAMNVRINSYPPMSILQTDHRDVNMNAANFGFATPVTYRHLLDCISEGVIIIYPPRTTGPDSDEGCEFAISYEKSLAQELIDDPEWNKFFEYRGVDAEDAVHSKLC